MHTKQGSWQLTTGPRGISGSIPAYRLSIIVLVLLHISTPLYKFLLLGANNLFLGSNNQDWVINNHFSFIGFDITNAISLRILRTFGQLPITGYIPWERGS